MLQLFLPACRNVLGNPHKVATPPRIVPALHGDLSAEPASCRTGARRQEIEVLFQHPGLTAYTVRLGACIRVKLLRVEMGDSPDCLSVTLALGRKAPPQKVPVIFTNGIHTFTFEFRILEGEEMMGPKG